MLGTAMRHIKEKDEIDIIIATNGEKQGDPKQRVKDSKRCAEKIKSKGIIFMNFPDTRMPEQNILIQYIEEIINRKKPDRIYTHPPKDTHQDHRAISQAVQTAGRNIREILFFESPSSQLSFLPTYFVDITKFMKKKLELLNNFRPYYKRWYLEIEAINGTAQFRGYQAKVKYAEAFQILRMVKT